MPSLSDVHTQIVPDPARESLIHEQPRDQSPDDVLTGDAGGADDVRGLRAPLGQLDVIGGRQVDASSDGLSTPGVRPMEVLGGEFASPVLLLRFVSPGWGLVGAVDHRYLPMRNLRPPVGERFGSCGGFPASAGKKWRMSENSHPGSEITRRAIVAGTGVLAVTAALAACSSSPSQGSAAPTEPTEVPAEPFGSPGSAAGRLAATSDIPVGGGKVFASDKVVVTQPVQGTFKAFSAICTHEGCKVNKVANGTIGCPCHGSKFAIADGSVVHGPASRPLPARQITVSEGEVRLESS